MLRYDLAVLGAGPAGLAAAWKAAELGCRVVVIERADRVGGLAGSFSVAGVRVDHGSHRLHPSTDPRVLADLRQLLGDDLQRRERNGRIRLADRWIAFPLRGADLVRTLPPSFALKAARDAALSWARRPQDDTFAGVLSAGLGPTLCEHFYFPYARKLWGREPARLDAEQARRRVGANSPAKLLRRVVARSERSWFWYPRRGYGQISEALASAATSAGADLRLGCAAETVQIREQGISIRLASTETVEAARVWSTLPIPLLCRMLRPPADEAVEAAGAALSYRALLLVYLVLDVGRYTSFDAHYLPGSDTVVSRLSEPRNYRDGNDPEATTVLCAEIPCDPDGPLVAADRWVLAGMVTDALRRYQLPPCEPIDVVVKRLAHAYPVYDAGYAEAFATLDDWVAGIPGLLTLGRQGLFAHDNAHHAMVMAYDAVDALGAGDSFDAAAWAAARRRFATHVVED